MKNRIIASLITLGVLGLVVLLFYGVIFHRETMMWVFIGMCSIGGSVAVCAVVYYIWEFVYDLLEG
jgi:hypothetical protein